MERKKTEGERAEYLKGVRVASEIAEAQGEAYLRGYAHGFSEGMRSVDAVHVKEDDDGR